MNRFVSHGSLVGKPARIALGLRLMVAVSGCFTTRSPELPPEQLREKIAGGDMLQAGRAAGASGAVAVCGAFWYLIRILPAPIVGAAL